MGNRIRTLVAEEMYYGNLLSFLLRCGQGHMKGAPNETRTHSYYGLIFPRVKQCRTMHDELTTTYLLPEQTQWNKYRNDMKYKKSTFQRKSPLMQLKGFWYKLRVPNRMGVAWRLKRFVRSSLPPSLSLSLSLSVCLSLSFSLSLSLSWGNAITRTYFLLSRPEG